MLNVFILFFFFTNSPTGIKPHVPKRSGAKTGLSREVMLWQSGRLLCKFQYFVEEIQKQEINE